MSLKIKELPEAERPYEKLELYGEKSLSNAELLAIIIKSGTKNETSVQIAQRILKLNYDPQMGDLNFLRIMSLEELSEHCMLMISHAGEGRTLVFEATKQYIRENYNEALNKLTEAEESLNKAHEIQWGKLMAAQMQGETIPFNMLLLHAMDLLMTATSEHDLLKVLIDSKMEMND